MAVDTRSEEDILRAIQQKLETARQEEHGSATLLESLQQQLDGVKCRRVEVAAALVAAETTEHAVADADEPPSNRAPGGTGSCPSAASHGFSTEQRARRLPRVLLGASMPHFLGAASVLRLIATLHARVCTFADVRIVLMEDATKVSGADALLEEVQRTSRTSKRLSDGAQETSVFSKSDQRVNPYHAANALASWADVLLIAPMCMQTLSSVAHHDQRDLLLEVVQQWGTIKQPTAFRAAKPILAAPRLPVACRGGFSAEKLLLELQRMGVTVVADPANDDANDANDVEELVEHVRYAILRAQGMLRDPSDDVGAKRRKGATA